MEVHMEQYSQYQIPLDKLKRVCDCASEMGFCKTSLDVPPLDEVIGQERAVRSMEFGLAMDAPGYNIYVVGPPGTGKSTYVQAVVRQAAAKRPVASDWCYINNFAVKDSPLAVSLPAGQGRVFQQDMDELISDLKVIVPKAFESSDYESQKDAVVQTMQRTIQERFAALEQESAATGLAMKQTPNGFAFIPLREGKPISSEDFDLLPIEQRHELEESGRRLQKKLDDIAHDGQNLEKQATAQINELESQITRSASAESIARIKAKYQDNSRITTYLDDVLADIVANHTAFKNVGAVPAQSPMMPFAMPQDDGDPFLRYKVNLFIQNNSSDGSPVVIEPNPNFYNLFGKIEYRSQLMSVNTDFTMIKPGALQRANGGFLILQIKDVLMDPFAWDALKKSLKYRQAIVENIGEQYRMVPTATLRPEPIPLSVKIILIGSPILNMLSTIDEDFSKLFKVKVDFDTEMPRTAENVCQYVSLVSSLCSRENLLHFDRSALAKIIEYGSRLTGNQNKLSTRFNEVTEIVYEAVAMARLAQAELVEADHVEKAISERRYRSSRIEEKIQEMILQGKILIDTQGAVVGQVNGLAVIDLGGFMFGQPSRITARTYVGRGGVINIERETEMSGHIHTKGVLTLTGYLGGKFAQEKPLSLTAQITFEQNYEGVDGDSASSTELYAILSSLSGLPLKQSLAVTGSVNQRGEIQPIGGATEKIEGFFDICRAQPQGLTGEQGVIIPIQNIDNLMLKDDVLNAVAAGKFRVYAVKSIDEGIEILSDHPAGQMDEKGQYPEDSVFGLAARKLLEYNNRLGAPGDQKDKDAKNSSNGK
jgi:lon-related putative ATP-dependent protease